MENTLAIQSHEQLWNELFNADKPLRVEIGPTVIWLKKESVAGDEMFVAMTGPCWNPPDYISCSISPDSPLAKEVAYAGAMVSGGPCRLWRLTKTIPISAGDIVQKGIGGVGNAVSWLGSKLF